MNIITSDRSLRLEKLIEKAKKDFEKYGVHQIKHHQAGISGGKDSTAIYLLAYELGVDITPTFCDTDNEHSETLSHATSFYKNLSGAPEVMVLKREYSEERFQKRRENLEKKWRAEHKIRAGSRRGEFIPAMTNEQINTALSMIKKTGNSFLDMCLLHGMFPLRRGQFCTDELKIGLVYDEVLKEILESQETVFSWSGVRADESKKRANYKMLSDDNRHQNLKLFSPIIEWTAEDVFAMHDRHGVEPNPLYKQGMKRVGCMPCINAGKDEINQIAKRFPEYIDKIELWESKVTKVSRWCVSEGREASMLGAGTSANKNNQGGVRTVVDWAATGRGGKTFDLVKQVEDVTACSSVYGLCE